MRAFVITMEALAALVLFLSAAVVLADADTGGNEWAAELAMEMQARDIAWVAGYAEFREAEWEAVAGELGACITLEDEQDAREGEKRAFGEDCAGGSGAGGQVAFSSTAMRAQGRKISRIAVRLEKHK